MRVIIDGNSIFYKIYFGLYNQHLSTTQGTETGAVYGFIKYLNFLIQNYGYSLNQVIITFDNPFSKTLRKEIYPQYKEGRKTSAPNLFEQLNILVPLLKNEGIAVLSFKNYEADDLCYAIARRTIEAGEQALIVSRDHDLLQILQLPNTIMMLDKGNDKKFIHRNNFFEVYDFDLDFFPFYKAIKGDSSDNIDGVKGVGDKTLETLAKYFEANKLPYDSILSTSVGDEKIQKILTKIQEDKEKVERNLKLMSFFDLPNTFSLDTLRLYQVPDWAKADHTYQQLEIRTPILRNF